MVCLAVLVMTKSDYQSEMNPILSVIIQICCCLARPALIWSLGKGVEREDEK